MINNSKKELVIEQYQTPSNLEARIELHRRFSTAVQPWPNWIFDQLDLPASSRILEVGCGPGSLWSDNLERLPAGWALTLLDLSPGMVAQARAHLLSHNDRFTFAVADAGDIPFVDNRFDAVIANHMLYHVADIGQTATEIQRILKPNGRLYAATSGSDHMRELDHLISDFLPHQPVGEVILSFTLQNGADQLRPFFPNVEMRRFVDDLLVTEAAPLVNYALSRLTLFEDQAQVTEEQKRAFEKQVAAIMEQQSGTIKITKQMGLFIASLSG
jgi:ubiquinone/menaquinone biosynthesis C-methylase UbiE